MRAAEVALQSAYRDLGADQAPETVRVLITDTGTSAWLKSGNRLREFPVEIVDIRTASPPPAPTLPQTPAQGTRP